MESVPSSPFRHGSTVEEELAYYKAQYEQLEVELQEFQASSKDLEAELEKDVEASEKRERRLKEKVEKLGFEVDEWKVTYPPSNVFVRARLTISTGETQAGQRRGKFCSDGTAEGGHDFARGESRHADAAA